MRLPGTRYQEHGWEQVRKLLGHCSLEVLAEPLLARLRDPSQADAALADFLDALAERLQAHGRRARGEAPGNSYGDTVAELALMLVYELAARPADRATFVAALRGVPSDPGLPVDAAIVRKQVNDVFAVLRDKVDSDNYMVACGRPCSPNRMYSYRMLDMAYADIVRLFAGWHQHREQVGAILGRAIDAEPIEARQLRGIGQCRAEWVLAWSASQERFGAGPGPLHTRSKRFAGLKDQPAKIQAMLEEIAAYEELSRNGDVDWRQDQLDAAGWLDDLDRVLDDAGADGDARAVSASPRYAELTAAMAALELPVRLAVYLKMLGPMDDSYPPDWLDVASGALPTMEQLAVMAGLSLPTLRKRRDAAIGRLLVAQEGESIGRT
jgi:hypothetical protein